ncbi:non-canonical purine NTP pyrophosphatase [Paenibacillus sp. J2TS4]|uniref:non-canonical purine NTP pyrophosphatase n=1 Tax=Paenibacillus sp. J2TS4 TaxID=2807194 RepID=UPI001B1C8A52|nr:non-canonical purine NTP pyrophosphatase [Paenibacillus sp. J2TS4]GIP32015.1 non-canonical purine NTP pyrophosphatase, RdgB/HAM1 family [Paenibacillus sp. J2TS4]
MELFYVTSNSAKFEIATRVLEGTNVHLQQSKIDVPEIQSMEVSDVAHFSSMWARDNLGCSVVITDVGLYINALNGFPGPFVKYANSWLTTEDVLRLLEGKKDRTVFIKECLAFCPVDSKPLLFHRQIKGMITREKTSGKGSLMDRLVVPENHILLSELSNDEFIDFWVKYSAFHLFKDWILSNQN